MTHVKPSPECNLGHAVCCPASSSSTVHPDPTEPTFEIENTRTRVQFHSISSSYLYQIAISSHHLNRLTFLLLLPPLSLSFEMNPNITPNQTPMSQNSILITPSIKDQLFFPPTTLKTASQSNQNMPFDLAAAPLYSGRRSLRWGAMRGCHWARKVMAVVCELARLRRKLLGRLVITYPT
jgi:hypothetical protein